MGMDIFLHPSVAIAVHMLCIFSTLWWSLNAKKMAWEILVFHIFLDMTA